MSRVTEIACLRPQPHPNPKFQSLYRKFLKEVNSDRFYLFFYMEDFSLYQRVKFISDIKSQIQKFRLQTPTPFSAGIAAQRP